MRIAFFSTKPYDRLFFDAANAGHGHELDYFEPRLTQATAPLAAGHEAVCAFVNDELDAGTLNVLAAAGVRLVALRCAGFNQVDLPAARDLGLSVVRVPAYSPYAVAEHAVGLMLALNRHLHRAYNRVREGNFALDGLLGFDLHGRTVGIVGTGEIGRVVARILNGFGCTLLAFDPHPSAACETLGVTYLPLDDLFATADVITLHCPLTPQTLHLVDAAALARMKPGVMLINTSRGALVDTRAAIDALKSGTLGYLGLDVYEEEGPLFFEDRSGLVIQDDVFTRLLTFPNVMLTGHQAFFTREALARIAATTLDSATHFARAGTAPAGFAVD
jgi:D-lactate dehydrogenase